MSSDLPKGLEPQGQSWRLGEELEVQGRDFNGTWGLIESVCLSFPMAHSMSFFSLLFLLLSWPRIPWAAGLMPPRPSWVTSPSLTCGTTS